MSATVHEERIRAMSADEMKTLLCQIYDSNAIPDLVPELPEQKTENNEPSLVTKSEPDFKFTTIRPATPGKTPNLVGRNWSVGQSAADPIVLDLDDEMELDDTEEEEEQEEEEDRVFVGPSDAVESDTETISNFRKHAEAGDTDDDEWTLRSPPPTPPLSEVETRQLPYGAVIWNLSAPSRTDGPLNWGLRPPYTHHEAKFAKGLSPWKDDSSIIFGTDGRIYRCIKPNFTYKARHMAMNGGMAHPGANKLLSFVDSLPTLDEITFLERRKRARYASQGIRFAPRTQNSERLGTGRKDGNRDLAEENHTPPLSRRRHNGAISKQERAVPCPHSDQTNNTEAVEVWGCCGQRIKDDSEYCWAVR
ncbi:hypothetical protein QBC46DRAFT_422790 [Diplogelasinospora grovesii]|uniref:Uncharacterized protein n=1 Tax=Diplogelasinospora grovesii TaxID=303347 RepID=A0AAN6N0P5_9PEZI|nr:hypothetical protein QBC46DRAFT_422790 [Diplogelasinospora grovesii]